MRARTLPDGTLVISYAAWLELFSALALRGIAVWALLDPTVSHRAAGWVCAGRGQSGERRPTTRLIVEAMMTVAKT